MKKKTILFQLTALLAAGCLFFSACGSAAPSSEERPVLTLPAPSETEALACRQTGDPEAAAVSSEHYAFSQGEMVYLSSVFYDQYYGYSLFTGLTVPEVATEYAARTLYYLEAAGEAGLDFEAELDTYMTEYEKDLAVQAAEYGWDIDTFLGQCFKTDVTWKYAGPAVRKLRAAELAYQALIWNKPPARQLEAEFVNFPKRYAVYDYIYVNLLDGENLSDAFLAQVRTLLDGASGKEDFTEAVKCFLCETEPKLKGDEAALSARTEAFLAAHTVNDAVFREDEISTFAFGGAEDGDIFVLDDPSLNRLYAYLLVRAPHKGENWQEEIRKVLAEEEEPRFLESAPEKYPVQIDKEILQTIVLPPE